MKTLLALIVLLLLALAAGPRTHSRFGRLSQGFFFLGGEFLIIGWALAALGILSEGAWEALRPLTTLGLSWIGLLLGLQFEIRHMRKIPLAFHAVGLMQGLLVLVGVSLAFYPLMIRVFGGGMETQAAALLLGAAAATSSQDILALAIRRRQKHPHAPVHLYRYSAALDSVIPVMVLVLLFGVNHGRSIFEGGDPSWLGALGWTGYATGLGIVLGLLFVFLLHRLRERSHHLLIALGFLAFSGGLALALDFPPLYVSFIAGLVLVNATGHHNRTWEIAVASERPFYFILLVLVGAGWHVGSYWALLLAPLFFLARILAKSLSLWLAGRIFFGRRILDRRSGLALSGQGATAVALVASVQLIERGTLADSALTMILMAVLLSGIFAPALTSEGLSRGVRR